MIPSIISGVSSASTRVASRAQVQNMAGLHDVNIPTKKATFALGCFWGCDALYGATLGVIRTRVGYAGGTKGNPTYKNILDYTEAIEIDYDPKEVGYEKLLDLFWANHDPTAKFKKQYTSIIFFHDDEQKAIAEKTKKETEGKLNKSVVTAIEKAGDFYNAEDYHQKYRLQQHPFLMQALKLQPNTDPLIKSHIAARLNGYVVGCGGVKQFETEKQKLGLDEKTADYVRALITRFEGHGLMC